MKHHNFILFLIENKGKANIKQKNVPSPIEIKGAGAHNLYEAKNILVKVKGLLHGSA